MEYHDLPSECVFATFKIWNGEIDGFLVADFSFDSPEARQKYEQFPPLFKHQDVGRDDVCEDLRAYLEANNLVRKPQRQLISSFWAEQALVTSELCRFYMRLGCSIK